MLLFPSAAMIYESARTTRNIAVSDDYCEGVNESMCETLGVHKMQRNSPHKVMRSLNEE
jgi:hypothetical protein